MAWPTTAVATGELITAAQLNGLPVMIANTTLSGSASSIEFASIPQHYAHLLVEIYARGTNASLDVSAFCQLNNDTAGNYDHQILYGNGATAAAAEAFAQTGMRIGNFPAASATANVFGAATVEIPHYAQGANQKALITENASKVGTATTNLLVLAAGGCWRGVGAVGTVTIFASLGSLAAGSRATLYGLPG